jgi:hypothetical protein
MPIPGRGGVPGRQAPKAGVRWACSHTAPSFQVSSLASQGPLTLRRSAHNRITACSIARPARWGRGARRVTGTAAPALPRMPVSPVARHVLTWPCWWPFVGRRAIVPAEGILDAVARDYPDGQRCRRRGRRHAGGVPGYVDGEPRAARPMSAPTRTCHAPGCPSACPRRMAGLRCGCRVLRLSAGRANRPSFAAMPCRLPPPHRPQPTAATARWQPAGMEEGGAGGQPRIESIAHPPPVTRSAPARYLISRVCQPYPVGFCVPMQHARSSPGGARSRTRPCAALWTVRSVIHIHSRIPETRRPAVIPAANTDGRDRTGKHA